jgi:ABC-2 type transport system permease protein
MTRTLVLKLLRDARLALLGVAFLLGGFQVFWYKTTDRVIGELSPFFTLLATRAGLTREDVEERVFDSGVARLAKTIIGGDRLNFDGVMDMLSIGYVHPLMQTVFCVWAVGRAAGAIAGELDRGTMELLLSQPLARFRVVVAHFCVDLVTIPLLCLSLWGGTCLAYWVMGPIKLRDVELPKKQAAPNVLVEGELVNVGGVKLGTYKATIQDPTGKAAQQKTPEEIEAAVQKRLEVRLLDFLPALVVVGGLMFAVTGYTMTLSALGRFRWRVLGVAVFLTLLQFMVNVLGQLWDGLEPLRPLTIFYYYQPQQAMLGQGWTVPVWGVRVPYLAVLYGVGLAGYAAALWVFSRRDLPAPL